MSEGIELNPLELARQGRRHLESLRNAGIEWLPRGCLPTQPEFSALLAIDAAPAVTSAQAIVPMESSTETVKTQSIAEAKSSLNLEERRTELQMLAARVAKCTRCTELASTRTQTVFGVGNIQPELCFVGEAPGADEDAQGEPFVGAAGQLLNKIIIACGMTREEVYICNILKCRPPGNRQPLPDEAAHCREYLERQLELLQPKFICALGACAAQNLLGTTVAIGKLRGQFQSYRGIPVLCTYHPAYLLRSPDKKRDVWEDMKKLLVRMGKPIPNARV